ncbi:5732_t:CDS:2, partial [Paraglomus occultum]
MASDQQETPLSEDVTPQEEASPTDKIVEITDADKPALANQDEDAKTKENVNMTMTAAERQREEELAKKKAQEALEWQEKFKQMINRLAMQEALNSPGSLTSKNKESKTHKFWDTQPVPRL